MGPCYFLVCRPTQTSTTILRYQCAFCFLPLARGSPPLSVEILVLFFFSPAGDNGSDRGGGDSDEEEEEERAAFERAVTEVANKVMQDAEKKMGSRGGGVQNAAFESLQVQMCVGVDS